MASPAAQLAAQVERERDRGVEMRARDRAQHGDEHDEHGAGRQRVGEQRDGDVAAGEALAHDAGADDCREQQRRAEQLGGSALPLAKRLHSGLLRSVDARLRPMSSRRRCKDSLSSEPSGRLQKMPMR